MEGRKKWLKPLAFVPALVLVGGFIGCRSGAFQMFSKPESVPEPHPLGLNAPNPPDPEPTPAPEGKRTYMPGSKSMMIGIPRPSPTTPADPPNPAPATSPQPEKKQFILGGSPKSDIIFRSSDLPASGGTPNNPTPPPP